MNNFKLTHLSLALAVSFTIGLAGCASSGSSSSNVKAPVKTPEKPDNGGTDKPDNGGNDKPDNGSNDKPDNGGNDKPDNGGNDKPDNGGNDKPDNGGNDKPDNGGNDKPDNGGADKPQPLAELNETLPAADTFLAKVEKYQHDVNDDTIVRLENTTVNKTQINFDKGDATYNTEGSRPVYGLNVLFYDDNGKLKGVTPGDSKYLVGKPFYDTINPNFAYKKDNTKNLIHLTDEDSTNVVLDAGLKKGDKFKGLYAGVYQNESKFIWRDPAVAGWNYQTFGSFNQTEQNSSGLSTVHKGYQSIGQKTDGATLPQDGTATYNGISVGHYYDASGNGSQTTSDVKVLANFKDKTLAFTTENTMSYKSKAGSGLEAGIADNKLDLTGSAKWDSGKAQFLGTVKPTNSGGTLNEGTIKGNFYGNKAAEVGGVFGLQGASTENRTETYIGGFGAKRK